jgi:hypothetical protein
MFPLILSVYLGRFLRLACGADPRLLREVGDLGSYVPTR